MFFFFLNAFILESIYCAHVFALHGHIIMDKPFNFIP